MDTSPRSDATLTTELELLRERARRYATAEEQEGGDAEEVVLFRRGLQVYGVPLSDVREVRPLPQLCRLPGASRVAPGVFHFRGEVVSAHDLAAYLNPTQDPPDAPWVLIVEGTSERVGLLADDLQDIVPVRRADLRPLPITMGERAAGFTGLTPQGALCINTSVLVATPAFLSAF